MIPAAEVAEPRGRAAAEDKLVSAAMDLLGEVGPRSTSVRSVAERAGVNHGLVHHYFGGKEGLLRAAMERLVDDHERWARGQSDGPVPAPLALIGDRRYLTAIVRAVLDGEMDLARTELDRGVSVPRAALDHLVERSGLDEPDAGTKALVALVMAMEMGWAALEPFLFAVTGVRTDEIEEVRGHARAMRTAFVVDAEART